MHEIFLLNCFHSFFGTNNTSFAQFTFNIDCCFFTTEAIYFNIPISILKTLVTECSFRMAKAGQGECEGKKIVKTEERKLSQADFEALTRYPYNTLFIPWTP